ncbi:MAG: hypothetical protein ACK52I_23175 [Pseudomonadota bacterium]|jgi:hypothetical protein
MAGPDEHNLFEFFRGPIPFLEAMVRYCEQVFAMCKRDYAPPARLLALFPALARDGPLPDEDFYAAMAE